MAHDRLHPYDRPLMLAALGLARRAEGTTRPNPWVGCVIARGAEILAAAATAEGGRPHAERHALQKIQNKDKSVEGATLYSTLEPCAHEGETPSCAKAIVGAKIARVCYAVSDPDARVSGRGAEILASAGVEVQKGLCASEAQESLAPYLKRQTQGTPFCTLKLAISLNGKISAAVGKRTSISARHAAAYTQELRRCNEAVLIGSGTLRIDDPMLACAHKSPRCQLRVVLDRSLSSVSLQSRLVKSAQELPLWVLTGKDQDRSAKARALKKRGVEVIPLAEREREREGEGEEKKELDLQSVLSLLAERGVSALLCEGGGRLATQLLRYRCLDRLVLYSAPRLLGEQGGDMWQCGEGFEFRQEKQFLLGQDLVTCLKPTLPQLCSAE